MRSKALSLWQGLRKLSAWSLLNGINVTEKWISWKKIIKLWNLTWRFSSDREVYKEGQAKANTKTNKRNIFTRLFRSENAKVLESSTFWIKNRKIQPEANTFGHLTIITTSVSPSKQTQREILTNPAVKFEKWIPNLVSGLQSTLNWFFLKFCLSNIHHTRTSKSK